MRFRIVCAIALALLLAGCAPQKMVQGPVGKMPDWRLTNTGPGAALMVMGPGISIVHGESLPVRHPTMKGESTEFVAQAWDGMGLEEIFVEVLSGGHIRSETGRMSTLLSTKASTEPFDLENEVLTLEGSFVVEAGAGKMLVRAGGVNVAGETVRTAEMEIRMMDTPLMQWLGGEEGEGEGRSNATAALCVGAGWNGQEGNATADLGKWPGECHTFSLQQGDLVPTDRLAPFEEWELDLREGCMREKITTVRNSSNVRLNVSVGVFSATLEPGERTDALRGAHFGDYYLVVAGTGAAVEEIQLEVCTE